ncbi:MAG: zinc-ribbon domain-containing protein [Clostridia bacterium]|nr:zinc-ribbon domain-containing protein [Clostridia bacterium]
MRYCTNCGSPVEDKDTYCGNCGHRIGAKVVAQSDEFSQLDFDSEFDQSKSNFYEDEPYVEIKSDKRADNNRKNAAPVLKNSDSQSCLVCGIMSLVFAWSAVIAIIFGAVGLSLGKRAREKDMSGKYIPNSAYKAGTICSSIGLALGIVTTMFYIIF